MQSNSTQAKLSNVFIASSLQRMLNYLFKQEYYYSDSFASFENKTFKVKIEEISVDFYLVFNDSQLSIQTVCMDKVSFTISTDLYSLKYFYVYKKLINVELSGDIELAEQLIQKALQVEVDWEELLSKYFGDFVSLNITHLFRDTKKITQQQIQRFENDIKEYVRFETSTLITQNQLNDFVKDTLSLKDKVLEIEKRIDDFTKTIN